MSQGVWIMLLLFKYGFIRKLSSVEEGVVSVGNSGHGVDLEVLVGTDHGNCLDWSPVGEGWLGIVEPLVAELFDVVVINAGNSLGNLASWDSSAESEHVLTNFGVDGFWRLGGQELVVEVVSASDDLNIVQVVGVDGWEANTAVVHLSGEDLVTEEVVSENTAVGVGHVVGVSSGDIWEGTEKSVHGVVLLVDIVEVLSMLVDSVSAEHVLEEQEAVVVLILDAWGIVEDTNVGVDHLVISDHQKSWDVNWLLGVQSWDVGGLWKGGEGVLDGIDDLVVRNVTSSNNDDVVTVVVGGVVVSEVVGSKSLSQISVSLDWLTEHVLSVGVEMDVFEGGFNISIMVVLVLHADLILDKLELSAVESWVGDQVTEEADSLGGVTLEALQVVGGELSVGVSAVSSTHVLDSFSELRLGSGGGTSEGHLLEEVRDTGGGKILVS